MGTGRPSHGPMPGHPVLDDPWWSCHAQNASSSPIQAKLLVRTMNLHSRIAVRADPQPSPFITDTHRGLGINMGKMEVDGSAIIAMGGYLTNVYCYGTVAVGDMMRMTTSSGTLRQEDTTTRTGHVMAFAMGTSTNATGHKKINILLLPWRI